MLDESAGGIVCLVAAGEACDRLGEAQGSLKTFGLIAAFGSGYSVFV
jgi:hypothetical protein